MSINRIRDSRTLSIPAVVAGVAPCVGIGATPSSLLLATGRESALRTSALMHGWKQEQARGYGFDFSNLTAVIGVGVPAGAPPRGRPV